MSKFYVGDVGTLVKVDVGQDVTSATTLELRVKKPRGKIMTWTAELFGTQELRYTVQAGDWDEAGVYTIQAYVVMPAWQGHGDSATFTISGKFQ